MEEWDEELEMTQAKLAQTLRAQDKAKIKLGEARSRYERAKAMLSLAGKKEAEIRRQELSTGSKSDEARRRGEEARRRGLSEQRWVAESGSGTVRGGAWLRTSCDGKRTLVVRTASSGR